MFEKAKIWFQENQKIALIGVAVIAVGFFIFKKMSRKSKYNKLMRRA